MTHEIVCGDCGKTKTACEDEREPTRWTKSHAGRCCDCFDLTQGCPPEVIERREKERVAGNSSQGDEK